MKSVKKVLIVDDDHETRQLVKKVLKKLDYVEFLEAESGEEAIAYASYQHPELILMDVLMPGIDGYETCRRIKSDPLLKSTIVIFMTAVTMDEIEDKIIQVHGDDLLRKPLDACELYFRVKNYLTLTQLKKEESVLADDLQSNREDHFCNKEDTVPLGKGFFYQPKGKYLCREDHFIPLMQQEIWLLEELIRCKNRVVSYEQLLHAIGKNDESSQGNLRTLIKLLRRKTYKELIITLPSIGYRLVL